MFYTGIGSRRTPDNVLEIMERAAIALRNRGFILRSGGANGADAAFEKGAMDMAEIYLPWPKFNGRTSTLNRVSEEAVQLALSLVPDPGKDSVRRLFGRNAYQVLGYGLNNPSTGVIYWAPETHEGVVSGGTRVAVYLARKHNIPCINLYFQKHREYLMQELNLI